jgi:hypothetical protein
MHTDFTVQIMMDASRRIAELQNTTDKTLGALRTDFRLFHQDTIYHRTSIMKRLDDLNRRLAVLEAKAKKPPIDIVALWQNLSLWLKVIVLLASGATAKELLAVVSASLGN